MPRKAVLAAGLLALVPIAAGPAGAGPPLPPPEHDPEQVRRLADEILSQREFHPQENPLQKVVGWIGDGIEWVIEQIFGSGGGPTVGGGGGGGIGGLGWIVLIALTGLAVWLVVRIWSRLQRDPAVKDQGPDVEVEEIRSAGEWQADADRLEAEGRWKEAMLARYRGLVATLVQAGVLEPIPGRTSGEYRRELSQSVPVVAADFSDATELFERAWYGDLPTGPEEAARFRQRAGRVLEEARS